MLLFAATAVNAQTIVKGDMNDDNNLTIADAVSLVDVILGKSPMQTISLGGDPYKVDNALVVGTWYAPEGWSFTLSDDGTTDYPGATTYKFRPYQGTLMFYNASGRPVTTIVLNEVDASYLLAIDYATRAYTYYTKSTSLASGITLDQTSLTINSGTTAQLTASIKPAEAFATITWTSSDESVATVDANGLVTAVAGGTCTITAKTSGNNKTATCSVTVKQMVTSIVLSQTTAVLESDGIVRLSATVLPVNASNKTVVWSSNNEAVAGVVNGTVVAAGSYGTAVITCEAADGSGVTATCIVYIPDPSTYVNLGLPSGTLWATCNIGATSPEDYGDYFAWGETAGYNDGKTNFNWSTYKWCEGSSSTMTKYCTDSSYGYNGFTDNKTELDLEDDAAYVNWGPAWRMPSIEQFAELINSDYTTTEWTTQNGVYGRKITSKVAGYEGNFIFLPAAGERDNSSLGDAGSDGNYWSRTLGGSYPNNARGLYFHSGFIGTYDGFRYYGRSVRPVRLSE